MDTTEFLLAPETALAGAILATAGAAVIPLTAMLVRRLVPERRVFFARWGFSHVAMAVLVILLGSVAAQAVLAQSGDVENLDPLLLIAVGIALPQMVACGVVFYWARRNDPDGVRCLGLRTAGSGRAVLAGLVAYVLSLPFLVGLLHVWPWLLTRLGETPEPQAIAEVLEGMSGARAVLAGLLVVVVVPLFEELLFRGFLQPLLVQNFRDRGGVVMTAAIFASLHGASSFLPLFGLALLLGFLMLRTQRLACVWAVHALHNGLMFTLLLLAPEVSP